jgi:mRNA-degrading endonuclease YafQ of YafQ-DinJ toxin-antitoxin module
MITKKEITQLKQQIKSQKLIIKRMEKIILQLIKKIPMPTKEQMEKAGMIKYIGKKEVKA